MADDLAAEREADLNGAIDDLRVHVERIKSENTEMRHLLEVIGRDLYGWVAKEITLEQLRTIPRGIRVQLENQQHKVKLLEERIEAMKKTSERTILRRDRARIKRWAKKR